MRIRSKAKRKNDRFKKPGRWLAMGALAACPVSGNGVLKGQTPPSRAPQPSGHELPALRFAIEAGALGNVFKEFARASEWKVEIPHAGMAALPSKGAAALSPTHAKWTATPRFPF